MDKIKNGTLEKISIEQAKADGLNLTGSTKQVARYKLLDDNYNKTNLEGFDIGGINCFWCIVMWMARTWWQ